LQILLFTVGGRLINII